MDWLVAPVDNQTALEAMKTPQHTRDRIARLAKMNWSRSEIAKELGMAVSTVGKYIPRSKRTPYITTR